MFKLLPADQVGRTSGRDFRGACLFYFPPSSAASSTKKKVSHRIETSENSQFIKFFRRATSSCHLSSQTDFSQRDSSCCHKQFLCIFFLLLWDFSIRQSRVAHMFRKQNIHRGLGRRQKKKINTQSKFQIRRQMKRAHCRASLG